MFYLKQSEKIMDESFKKKRLGVKDKSFDRYSACQGDGYVSIISLQLSCGIK